MLLQDIEIILWANYKISSLKQCTQRETAFVWWKKNLALKLHSIRCIGAAVTCKKSRFLGHSVKFTHLSIYSYFSGFCINASDRIAPDNNRESRNLPTGLVFFHASQQNIYYKGKFEALWFPKTQHVIIAFQEWWFNQYSWKWR